MSAGDAPAPRPVLHGAYPDFQGVLDVAFEKASSSASVPWKPEPAPGWAQGWRPRVIMDLGSAEAHFTSAVLDELGAWGCLAGVSRLVLVEEEPGFNAAAYPAGLAEARERCAATLARHGRGEAEIELINETITVADGEDGARMLVAGGARLPRADLIIASHVTYYFPDGGAGLVRALEAHLEPDGMAWLVVRRRECPIYRERLRALEAEARLEAPEPDYAEDIEGMIAAPESGLDLVEARDLALLSPAQRGPSCEALAHLLMWRSAIGPSTPSWQARAVRRACEADEPLFIERHMIVRRR